MDDEAYGVAEQKLLPKCHQGRKIIAIVFGFLDMDHCVGDPDLNMEIVLLVILKDFQENFGKAILPIEEHQKK